MADGLIVILDGHFYGYRFHFGGPRLTGPDGRPTGVTFAFADLFARLRRDPRITHIAAVFDHPEPSFRHRLFPEYKAHRDPMPEDLARQMPDVATVADAMGIRRLAVAGYEADDVIATIARSAERAGMEARICTRDKDIDQVISERIATWDPLGGALRGPAEVRAERRVDCAQIVDYLVMIGDTADNVPGIRGVGPKTAAALLERYGCLDGVFAHLDELRGKRREHIAAFRDRVALTRDLIAIREVPGLPPLDAFAKPDGLAPAGSEVLAGFGFTVARFIDAPRPPSAAEGGSYPVLRGAAVVARCDRVRLSRRSAAVVPLTGTEGEVRALGLALAGEDRDATCLDLDTQAARDAVADLLADPAVPLVVDEAAGTLARLQRAGLPVATLAGDPALAAWLLDPDAPRAGLAERVRAVLGENLEGERDPAIAAGVAAQCVLRLHQTLLARLEEHGLDEHFRTVELPCSAALAAASAAGLGLDRVALRERREHLEAYRDQIASELRAIAGDRFDPGAERQVADLLFRRLGLAAPRLRRGVPLVDDQVLECLRDRHEAADLLLQHRQLARLLASEVRRLDAAVDPVSGRIHPRWDPRGTHGALRCGGCDPARLPGHGQLGRELRAALHAHPQQVLVAVRLPHPTLHLLARFADDDDLRAALVEDDDPHRAIAARLLRRERAGIGPAESRISRELHRALLDGGSPFALAQRLGIPRGEAASLLDEHARLFPATAGWLDRAAREAARRGSARSLHGRPRRIVLGANATDELRGRRDAIAWILTASTWDLLKQALVSAQRDLDGPLLPLDDGLAVAVEPAATTRAEDALRDALLAAWPDPCPPRPSVHRGPSLLAVG